MTHREEMLKEDLKRLMGLPPYNTSINLVYGDDFFLQDLIQKHGKRMVDRIQQELIDNKEVPQGDKCIGCGKINTHLNEKQLCLFCNKQFGKLVSTPQRVIEQPKVKEVDNSKLEALLQKMRDKSSVAKPIEKVELDGEIQTSVDVYLELHEQYKQLEKQLEDMKHNVLEPFMNSNSIQELKGTTGGKVQLVEQWRSPMNTKYTSYEVSDIEQFLSASAKKKCIVKRIDTEILEAMIKTGEVDSMITELKVTTPVVYIKVDHR